MIRMGIPEMEELWNRLQRAYRAGNISKDDEALYRKWGKKSIENNEIPARTVNRKAL